MTCYKTAEILASIFHVEKLGTETIILELCCQKCKTFKYPSKPVLHTKRAILLIFSILYLQVCPHGHFLSPVLGQSPQSSA